ncbi:MAG TPA: PEP-CTERM sorting domain-containing protein [Candidatus Manganitrophaceae bacterium]|nr:PEP-CTERM sorting domain-containing protein [Candidatus Manganitrophaceae bacterium]
MRRKQFKPFLGILIFGLILLLARPSAYAIPDWSFTLIPANGDLSGAPGAAVGWGYEITNLDSNNWLLLTGVSADLFQNGTPDAFIFDYPILAPGATASVPYTQPGPVQAPSGLYQFTWDAGAPVGFVNSGTFILTAEWYDGDPLAGGAFLDFAPDKSALYSVTVTSAAVPEPATLWPLISGMAGFGLWRRKVKSGRFKIAGSGPTSP